MAVHKGVRAVIAVAVAMAFVAAGATSAHAATVEDDVFAAVNAERANADLPPLKRDSTIEAAAEEWAGVMASSGNFTHSSSQWRADRIPPGWDRHGENIAWGYRTVDAVMDGWMGSAGHRANILHSGYTRIGIGYVASGNYWVQIFAGYAADRQPQLSPAPVPTIAGTPTAGRTLTATAGTWGPSPVSLAFQWRANGAAIAGATGQTLVLRALEVGARITVSVTGTRSGYASAVRTSAQTAVVVSNRAISRISGADRYDVANAIALRAYPVNAQTVYLVTGTNYPDALSAAPAAIAQGAPLLLTSPSALPDSVRDEISRLEPTTVVVVGGTSSVSDDVLDSVRALGPTVIRISGADRYAASRAVTEYAFGTDDPANAYLATGANFPDALSAGSAAGSVGAPVILVPGAAPALDSATGSLLYDLGTTRATITGGTASVSTGIERDLSAVVDTVRRLAGADRYAASVAINADAFSRSTIAYLATGLNYPDALAGSALAGKQRAPLFLVPSSCVPRAVLAELDDLGTTTVVLLGGPASLDSGVAALVPCGW